MAEGNNNEPNPAFHKSMRDKRGPLHSTPKATKKNGDCKLCEITDERLPMIQCDSCDVWFHFRCVGLITFDETQLWVCPDCKKYNENYDDRTIKAHACCQSTNKSNTIRCRTCRAAYHTACLGIQTDNIPQDWICNVCYREKPASIKARSFTSSAKTKADLKIDFLTEIKDLKDKAAQDEMNIVKQFMRDQHKRDVDFVISKFDTIKDLDDYEEDCVETQSQQDDELAIELIKDRRLKNWLNNQETSHLRSRVRLSGESPGSTTSDRQRPQLSIKELSGESPVGRSPSHQRSQQSIVSQQNRATPNTSGLQRNLNSSRPQAHHAPAILQNQPDTLTRLQIASRQAVNRDLPHFNGDADEWLVFISAYKTSTKMCGYRDEENLIRLQKCLKDKAKTAVRNFLTFPSNVPLIIETLQMLFGNEEKILHTLLDKIRKQSPPKPDDLTSIIDYAMSVRNLYGTIESSGMESGMNNSLLIQELVDKLPPQIKLNWGVYKVTLPKATLKHLSDWLYEIAKGACSVTISREKPQPTESKSKDSRNNLNVHQTPYNNSRLTGSNTTSESSSVVNNEKKCCLCRNKVHGLNECPDFTRMSSEQRWLTVKNNRMCRFCLGPHFYLKCKQRSNCGINGCEYKHHPKLHQTIVAETTQKKTENSKKPDTTINQHPTEKSCHVHSSQSFLATFRYIAVRLYNGIRTLQVIAFLDEGATSTMVNRNVVEFLGIQSDSKQDLLLKWTGGVTRVEEDSQIISLEISGAAPGSTKYKLDNISTVNDLDLNKQSMDVKILSREFPYLRRIPAYSYVNTTAQMIIGLDNWKLGIPLKVVDRGWNEPVATKTRLGWEIHGEKTPLKAATINHHTRLIEYDKTDDELHNLVLDFFSLDNFGVKVLENSLDSKENIRSKNILESTMRNIGDRYEVGLLWKNDNIKLPDSFPMAVSRYRNFQRQLKLKPKLATTLMEQMKGYVDKGYVEKLSDDEADIRTERTWYLPIFPKTYPKKPDKVRLVWDAAAKVGGTSLNSMLIQGPDNYSNLVDILRRFRERKIPLLADIKEWYHQIKVIERDQDSQRFLWPSNDPQREFDVYKLKVLSFGAACSPSTAIEVKSRHASKYEKELPRAAKAIIENHYVDDWLDRFDTEDEAIKIGREVKHIHSKAGFEIRNWISCSPDVIKALDGDPKNPITNLNCDLEHRTERVLGMWWRVEPDVFTFSLKYSPVEQEILTGKRAPTKREMLRTLMSIYDPLGFLASFLVHVKILLQDTWRMSIGWDDQVTDYLNEQWESWIAILPRIEDIRIPRHYSPKVRTDNQFSVQLHTFVDAGEPAYAAVSYLRIEDENGVDIALVGGKTKTAPLKPLSTPKLELQSFVLGVRLSNSIVQSLEIPISRRYVWTDSSTVIRWLRSDHRKYNQFVGARVGEILEGSISSEWHWIPRNFNVADDATRWRGEPDISTSSRWFRGPEFLKEPESNWPKTTFDIRSEPLEGMRKCFLGWHSHDVFQRHWIDIEVQKFSDYMRLVRVQVWVRRFLQKLLKSIRPVNTQSGPVIREEFQRSEIELFQRAQYDGYREEILTLKSGKEYVDRTSKIYRHSPYLDEDGVLRMKGRIDAAKCISFDTKRPIILPINYHVTQLIVLDYHKRFYHQNDQTVLNEIRQRFLILGVKVFLNRFVPKLCQLCKNRRAVPKPPQMADLPEARLTAFTKPFSYVGIDYAGPFYVTMFRRVVKRWIVLFTCLVVRAIHIEIASSMDTDSCIMCIRNFMNIRGKSVEIFTDNGTDLVGGNNELNREIRKIDQQKLHDEFTNSYTKWNFNPPTAPHMGGVWERLVRSVKTTLSAVMPHNNPNDELFRCWLMEVMNVVNSRPLTFVPFDPDCEEALTPNHFLLGSSNGMKPPGVFTNEGLILRRNWRIAQQLTDNFWKKWIMEYLPIIARRSKWFEKVKPIEVNDIVLMIDEDNVRNSWPKGRIIEVFPDKKSGQVRSVMVETERGTYKRPVHGLAVLDVRKSEEVVEFPLENSTEGRMLTTAAPSVIGEPDKSEQNCDNPNVHSEGDEPKQ